MKLVFVPDIPSISASKQNRVLSYTEARELKICADMGLVPDVFGTYPVLRRSGPVKQIEEVFTTDVKIARKYGYHTNMKGNCYIHPKIEPLIEDFRRIAASYPEGTIFLPMGPLSFWALTGGIQYTAHIGSIEQNIFGGFSIPVWAPATMFKVPERRLYTARGIRRAFELASGEIKPPEVKLIISPTFGEVLDTIGRIYQEGFPVSADIETVSRHISCIALCNNEKESISIPFITHGEGRHEHYFSHREEVEIVLRLKELLTTLPGIWQNGAYDKQHIIRSWYFNPRNDYDTLLMYHSMYPGLKKDLAVLGSLYIPYYQYWKDENKDFTVLPEDLHAYWRYNAKDTYNTLVIKGFLEKEIEKEGTREQWELLQRSDEYLNMISLRGVRINTDEKWKLANTLLPELTERKNRINVMAGQELNIASPLQMKRFFYDELQLSVQKDKKTHQPTCNDLALTTLAGEEPLVKPIVDLISVTRSIGVFLNTFVMMPLDIDGRMRCSYNVGGPETYRLSSSKNPFGSGGNLQNIPKGQEEEDGDTFKLPNLRRMFIPDPGMLLFDVDLAGADAQVVAWEAEDEDLKAKFRSGEKIHALNAKDMYGALAGPDGKKAPYYKQAKMGTHLSNYGGTPKTLSKACAMLMHEAELFQRRWFQLHPGIKEWQNNIMAQLQSTGIIQNKFGFRRVFYERPDSVYTNALAWIPQSTIAIIIHKAMGNIVEQLRRVELLLQVHDSLVGQFPIAFKDLYLPKIRQALLVQVPYTDPLMIGSSLDISLKSWGDLESYS